MEAKHSYTIVFQIAGPNLHHQRVVFLISSAFPFTWAYRCGFVCLFWTYDVSQISFSTNLHIGNSSNCWEPLLHQRVVFLTSLVFPFTLAYRSGVVCLLWTYVFSSYIIFHWSSCRKCFKLRGTTPPSKCCVFDFITVSLSVAYRFVFVCRVWTYAVSHISCFY